MIDHLVLATPDVERTAAMVSREWGITVVPGGSHVGLGTRNELAGLGGHSYLEVVGPDVMQPRPTAPRPFGVDDLPHASLVTWCSRPARPLAEVVDEAERLGVHLGRAGDMSRRRPDGVLLEWQLTPPSLGPPFDGVLPFLIDWKDSPHPADTLSHEAELVSLQLAHPNADLLRTFIEILGHDERIEVSEGAAAIQARINTPSGIVRL
jgi:hypothetical protein